MRAAASSAICAALGAPGAVAAAHAQKFTSFDVPNSYQTTAVAINAAGHVTGNYIDGNDVTYGFLRTRKGSFVTLEPPGSTTFTYPKAINTKGRIAGSFLDSNDVSHGFVASGVTKAIQYQEFDPQYSTNTYVQGLNDAGVVVGYYRVGAASHGFVRAANRKITTFDPANSIFTLAYAINLSRVITGSFVDASHLGHAYVRAANGSFTIFDAPGGTDTYGYAINTSGVIVGGYILNNQASSFVRATDGTISTVQPPGSVSTYAFGINDAGVITGYYYDASFVQHGFTLDAAGNYTSIDAPNGPVSTAAVGINAAGVVTGNWQDTNNVQHGFVLTP